MRKIIFGATVIFSALVPACAPSELPPNEVSVEPSQTSLADIDATISAEMLRLGAERDEYIQSPERFITRYYGEGLLLPAEVIDYGSFETEFSTIHWFNSIPDITVNPGALEQIYRNTEELAADGLTVSGSSLGEEVVINVNPRSCEDKVLFFIPRDAPPPEEWRSGESEAGTDWHFDGSCVSFIRLPDTSRLEESIFGDLEPEISEIRPLEAVLQTRLQTEVCQAVVEATSARSSEVSDYDDVQETLCNFLGQEATARDLGLSEAEFSELITRHKFSAPVRGGEVDYFPPVGVSRRLRSQFPETS